MKITAPLLQRLEQCGIHPREIQIAFSRSQGPGGQHVNKVNTACTARHLPTGIAFTASDTRSQHSNKLLALARLANYFEQKKARQNLQLLAARAKTRRQIARRSFSKKIQNLVSKRHHSQKKRLRAAIQIGQED